MSVSSGDSISERGPRDARRHREKQKELIKKNLPAIISEEAIITSRQDKKIRIPIKNLQIPQFKHDDSDEKYGIGQGDADRGDIIDTGKAGDGQGEDLIESEVEIQEIIQMAMEDIGLPNMEDKPVKELLIQTGYKIKGRSSDGPPPLLNKKETAKQGLKRFWALLEILKQDTGKDDLICRSALKKADGDLEKARELLKDPLFEASEEEKKNGIQPFPVIETADLRYWKLKENQTQHSQAVVIAMMDVSGSMGEDKRYYAQVMLWWLTQFLRQIYKTVAIRFIIHHSEARLVDEEVFFTTRETGGTQCSSAYKMAGALIDSEYSPKEWNIYVFHFSDGEDYNVLASIQEMWKVMNRKVNMLGYCQINPDSHIDSQSDLLRGIESSFPVKSTAEKGLKLVEGAKGFPFLGMVITSKEHFWTALREFLKKERWSRG